MTKGKETLERVGYVLDCIALATLLAIAVGVLVSTLRMETVSWARVGLHKALGAGFALLFFRKLHRFKVDDKDSHVSYSGGWLGYLPITTSPYCVPLLTLVLLPWRYTTGDAIFLLVIDFLIGLSYAFHVCCWASQIRLYQSDIQGPGVIKSLLTISFVQIINFCLVLLAPSSGVEIAIKRVFWVFPRDFVLQAISLLQ